MKRRLQVFVSSTYKDLQTDRQAAVSAILKAGHIPAGMELFTAGDKSQMATIKRWIDESDIYMLILGGRYGSVEPTSGVSYTELEYDYAVQQAKPFFAVVITEAALEARVRGGGSDYMEKENPKELGLFRTKVLGNISSFFDDAKDIRLCVHESLSDFSVNRELKGWISADEVVDTRPLFDEIAKLSEENSRLKESLIAAEKKNSSQASKYSESMAELRAMLKEIEVKIPPSLAKGEENLTVDLLTLFYGNKDTLINGVTNAANASEGENFFFYNVCPKLQVHGLTINEKVAGARYRRYAVTNLGNSFLADMEREILLSKNTKEQSTSKNNTQALEPVEKPTPTIAAKRPRSKR